MEEKTAERCRRYDPVYLVRCSLTGDHHHDSDAFMVDLPMGVECAADVPPQERIAAVCEALRAIRNALWDARHDLREVHAANEGMGLALTELKQVVLIGPLTAEEWLEFRQRANEDEQHELLQCCGNTSEARDLIFTLMRSYAEDRLLGARIMARVWEIMQDHGMPEGRGTELLTRLHDYYQAEAA